MHYLVHIAPNKTIIRMMMNNNNNDNDDADSLDGIGQKKNRIEPGGGKMQSTPGLAFNISYMGNVKISISKEQPNREWSKLQALQQARHNASRNATKRAKTPVRTGSRRRTF